MTTLTSRDSVTLVSIDSLDAVTDINIADNLVVSQSGTVRKANVANLFQQFASQSELAAVETAFLNALGSYVNVSTAQEIGGTKTFTGQINVPLATADAHPIPKATFDAHLANYNDTVDVFSTHLSSTDNPHNIDASQVGNTTAQWNANKLQGRDVSVAAPLDGQTLIYDTSATAWVPGDALSLTTGAQNITGQKTFLNTSYFKANTVLDAPNNTEAFVGMQNDGFDRWRIAKTAADNFTINSYNTDGTLRLANALSINRTSGVVSAANGFTSITPSASDNSTQVATTAFVKGIKGMERFYNFTSSANVPTISIDTSAIPDLTKVHYTTSVHNAPPGSTLLVMINNNGANTCTTTIASDSPGVTPSTAFWTEVSGWFTLYQSPFQADSIWGEGWMSVLPNTRAAMTGEMQEYVSTDGTNFIFRTRDYRNFTNVGVGAFRVNNIFLAHYIRSSPGVYAPANFPAGFNIQLHAVIN